MTWPSGAVSTTNVDATSDDPELGVVDIKSAFDKLNQIIAHVSSYIQGLLDDADAAAALTTLGAAPLASPTFTGTPAAPTAAVDTNTTQLATTAYVVGQGYAKLASPALTGNPTAPTPSGGDNDTSIATTAFVQGELTAKAPLASPSFTGTASFAGLIDASGASAGQIKFPAAQNASANANTLDDYEEGTWTPDLGGTTTYNSRNGSYTKIGRLVSFRGRISVNVIGTGSTTIVSGFPFTVAAETVISFRVINVSVTAIVSSYGRINAGGTDITVEVRTAASTGDSGITAIFGNTTGFEVSGCIEI